MLQTIRAILKPDGTYELLDTVEIQKDEAVLVTLLGLEENEDFVRGVPVMMLLSEPALSDWLRPEEDEAWKDFQDESK